MKFYKRVVSITNVLWTYTWKLFLPLIVLLATSQCYFLYKNFANANFQSLYNYNIYDKNSNQIAGPWSLRFEEYLARSYIKEIFTVALIITIIILISIALRQKLTSKVEYTYLRIPVSKNTLFFTSIFYSTSILAILLAVQFIIILIGYLMYLYFVPEEAVMTGGLFLAFARWDFLKRLFPLIDPLKLIVHIPLLIHTGFIIAYVNMKVLYKDGGSLIILVGIFPFLINYYQGIITYIILAVVIILIDLLIFYSYKSMVKKDLGQIQEEGKQYVNS